MSASPRLIVDYPAVERSPEWLDDADLTETMHKLNGLEEGQRIANRTNKGTVLGMIHQLYNEVINLRAEVERLKGEI